MQTNARNTHTHPHINTYIYLLQLSIVSFNIKPPSIHPDSIRHVWIRGTMCTERTLRVLSNTQKEPVSLSWQEHCHPRPHATVVLSLVSEIPSKHKRDLSILAFSHDDFFDIASSIPGPDLYPARTLHTDTRIVVYTGPKTGLSDAQNKYNDCAQPARVHLTPPLSHTLHWFLIMSAQEGRTVKCPLFAGFWP